MITPLPRTDGSACWVQEFDQAAVSSVEPHRRIESLSPSGGRTSGWTGEEAARRSCAKRGATQQTCHGQASRQDEGERGWSVTRGPAARWWSTGNLIPEGPMRPGDVGLFPSGLRMITDGIRSGRSPVTAALFDERKTACCLRGRRRGPRLVPRPILLAGDGCTGRQDGEGLGPQELSPRRSDPP